MVKKKGQGDWKVLEESIKFSGCVVIPSWVKVVGVEMERGNFTGRISRTQRVNGCGEFYHMDNYYLLAIVIWEVVYKGNILDITIWQKKIDVVHLIQRSFLENCRHVNSVNMQNM